ncbi:MAG: leucyl aminopeptidase [Georgfuchsia sp.]
MEFSIKSGTPEKQRSATMVVGIFESRTLSPAAAAIDKASKNHLGKLLKSGDLDGKTSSSLLLHGVPGIMAERVLLVGLGKEKEFGDKEFRNAIAKTIATLNDIGGSDATICLTELAVDTRDAAWRVRQAVISATDALYRFDQLKSKKDDKRRVLKKLSFSVATKDAAVAEAALRQGEAIAEGHNLMKNLANLPGNHCTPSHLADQARALAREHKLGIDVLDRTRMKKLGMNTLLAVAQGSAEPPRFIVIKYNGGARNEKPIVLIGKGITFDSGGISLKPGFEMDEMKYDMSGAASVLGTLKAVVRMKLPLNVIGVIPSTENMPGGRAIKPGDIVTSMSGQTVEILNTDAEGRLILCDALTYVERFDPECVVDIATLTGACVIALGSIASGLLANNDALAQELLASGHESGDRAWQLPLWEDYQEQLKSNFADMANIGGRMAGTITAACFLARYAKKYQWAHLDVAGTAWRSGEKKGSTGRPLLLLTQFLINRASKVKPVARKKKTA